MIDIAIIGGGPAGLSAAVNARARNKNVMVFGRKPESAALYKAKRVDNHLGLEGMSGPEMMEKFMVHARTAGAEFVTGRVAQILSQKGSYLISCGTEFYEAKTVILAIGGGKSPKIEGEEKYLGRGVSYCATCDAMLYRGMDVAVLGETEEGDADAAFLSEVCKKVHYFPVHGEPTGLPDKVLLYKGKIDAIMGGDFVEAIKAGDESIAVDGVFLIKAASPVETLVYGLQLENGLIRVNPAMETNLPGVFACGDCASRPWQLSKAIGEGLLAAQNAAKYLDAQAGQP